MLCWHRVSAKVKTLPANTHIRNRKDHRNRDIYSCPRPMVFLSACDDLDYLIAAVFYFVIIAFLSLLRFAATRLYPVSLTVDIIAVRRPGRGQHHSVMIDITASSDPTVCIQIAMFIKMVPFPVNQLPAVGIEISVCKTIPPTVLILLPAASCPASVSINPVAIRG